MVTSAQTEQALKIKSSFYYWKSLDISVNQHESYEEGIFQFPADDDFMQLVIFLYVLINKLRN
jgi:hypothetical protein